MIPIVNGSLLDAQEKFIAHQCNATSRNAAGLAYSIFNAFPFSDIYSTRKKPDMPGHIVVCGDGTPGKRRVIDIVSQHYPGKPNENSLLDSSKAREGYFNVCLHEIAKIENLESIAFPFSIGCGLAGGRWENYLILLEAFAKRIWDEQKAVVSLYRI